MTSEPDVTRVLTKMGRADFGYRTFNTVPNAPSGSSAESGGLIADAVAPMQTMSDNNSAAAVFSLLGSCIPEAAHVTVERESHLAVSQPTASEPAQVATIGQPDPLPQAGTSDTDASTALHPPALFQPRPALRDSPAENVWARHLFTGRSMNTPNPFPPRVEPKRTSAENTTAMATVFRVLTRSKDGSQFSRGPERPDAAFSFRRG